MQDRQAADGVHQPHRGKNAKVRLWPDQIEWALAGRMGTGAKAALGFATAGMSLLATGVRGKRDTSMILVRSITGVTTREAEEFKRRLVALVGQAG